MRRSSRHLSEKAAPVFQLIIPAMLLLSPSKQSLDRKSLFSVKAAAAEPDDPLTRLENTIDEEESARKKALLKGLAWTARFVEDDKRLDFIFSNYVLFLRELTLDMEDAATASIASDLIENAFSRIKPRIGEVFPKSNYGKWDFISVLPFIYEFGLDRDFYYDFYISHFPEKHKSPYKKTFAKGIKTHNYDLLGDYLIDYSFLHYFNSDFPGHGFDLPGDTFDDYMMQVSALELIHDYASDADDYFDQNYYVTHIVYVATDYGKTGMDDKDLENRVADYLAGNLDYVFYYEIDIDLLAEYVHCLALLGRGDDETVQVAVDYLVSQQLHDGSWGTQNDFDGDFYDQFHPTWAVASALHGFN